MRSLFAPILCLYFGLRPTAGFGHADEPPAPHDLASAWSSDLWAAFGVTLGLYAVGTIRLWHRAGHGRGINLVTLIIVGLYLVHEAVARFVSPEPVAGWIVVIVAAIALAVDVATALLTYAMSKRSINVKAAFLHNVSDALASVGVIVAGMLIILYDLFVADLVVTLLIAAYVLYQGFSTIGRTKRGSFLASATPA